MLQVIFCPNLRVLSLLVWKLWGVKNRDMNYLTPPKTKTKIDKKLNFAGVVDYIEINILSKFGSPILISSEVIGGQKIVT